MITDYLLKRTARRARAEGDRARDDRRPQDAADCYRRYLTAFPADPAIWIQLGHMLTEAGDFDGADSAYRSAERLTPGDADLLLCWGHSRKRAGDTDAARGLYARSAASDGNSEAVENLAALTPRSSELEEPTPEMPQPPRLFAGRIERVEDRMVEGIVAEADAGVAIEFRVDGRVVGQTVPSRAGDSYRFRAVIDADEGAEVRAARATDGIELEGSPFRIDICRIAPAPAPAWAARAEVVKPFAMSGGVEVALFVTHSRTGALKPHVPAYLRALKEEGIAILLVAVVDHALNIPADILDVVDGAIVRENKGYDFAAWSHAMWLHPELYGASILYLLNDSVVGPAGGGRFGRLIERVRASRADLVGLTESHEYRWHVQSYFWAMKPRLLGSFDLHIFFRRIRLLSDKDQVIRDYELSFAFDVEQWGLKVEVLFPSPVALNPTLFAWRALLRDDFPFMKVLLLRGNFPSADIEGWQPAMREAGFDIELVEAAIRATEEPVLHDRTDLLSAHPPARDRDHRRPLRIALYGPLAQDGDRGAVAREMAETLRRSAHRLNLHPVKAPLPGRRLLAPMVDVADFACAPDLVLVLLDPAEWSLLTDLQRAAIETAPKRIGYWTEAAAVDRQAARLMDRIWVPDRPAAARLAGEIDTPVEAVFDPADPEVSSAALIEASLRRTMALDRPPPPELESAPSLAGGASFEEAELGEKIQAVPLAPDGSVETLPGESLGKADDLWIAFAPRGSLVTPLFARVVADHVRARPDAEIFYADDIAVETDEPVDRIRLKPEFDPVLLAAQDYVGAPVLVRASALAELGGLDRLAGTAATADLLFRASAAGLSIARIPEILLAHPGRRVRPTADDYRRMLSRQPSLTRYEVCAGRTPQSFELRRRFPRAATPAVTVLVPTRRSAVPGTDQTYIERLLGALGDTDWPMERLTVLVGDDISGEPDWAGAAWPFTLRRIETPRAQGQPFNYASKMNRLWREASDEQIIFLNDDVRPCGREWLAALQTFATDPAVGGVGARLLFEDGTLQHAGIAPHNLGAGHVWVHRARARGTYQDWALVHRQWSMVTGAVFATRRSLMDKVGGFDERFSLEFNDTDLCLRLRMQGYRIVSTPHAELVHAERASRGDAPPLGEEIARFLARWSPFLAEDPAWHPGLRRDRVAATPRHDPHAWYA